MSTAVKTAEQDLLSAGPEALLQRAERAVASADKVLQAAKAGVRAKVAEAGGIDNAQHAAHGLAWLATAVEGLRQMHVWGTRLSGEGRFGEFEQLILAAAFAEYLAQISGGIPMSQLEFVRPEALGVSRADVRRFEDDVADMIAAGSTQDIKARLADLIAAQPNAATFGDSGLDETHSAIHDQMRKFSQAEVVPHAHEWHLKNEYIPLEVIGKVAELGVFGLTLPEEYGGLALGKEAMCVVSEELSRGYIGVGSLGTRSEIAGELILNNGTDEQKAKYLPLIATGEMLPTAVFTEPNTGSDLASLKTRAVKDGDTYKVTGQKTWITHPVRADLMTLLVRTNPEEKGYKGLSMLLAEKPRGSDADPFPAPGMKRRRDRGARLSRHEGVRHLLRRLRGAGGPATRRHRGPGLQAADEHLRGGAHPDGGARGGRRPVRRWTSASSTRWSATSSASRSTRFRASPTRSS